MDRERGVLNAALDSVAQPHQSSETKVDRRLERVVSVRFRERLAVQRHGVLWDGLDASEMDKDGCPLDARRSRSLRWCEQGDCAAGIAASVMAVSCAEEPSSSFPNVFAKSPGAPTVATRVSSLISSFLGRGVPEYPAEGIAGLLQRR